MAQLLQKHVSKGTRHVLYALIGSGAAAFALLLARFVVARNLDFWFLPWNLFLAYIPALFAYWFVRRTEKTRLMQWQNILIAVLWLGFLPNSFYIVSDLIHLRATGDVSILYDAVMVTAFVWSGFLAGYVSLFMMHRVALRQFSARTAHMLVAAVLLLCSFAIYLGRYLRWNTWDIILNPFGLVFDVSERFLNPLEHPQAFSTTVVFFVLLTSVYWSAYQIVAAIKAERD